MSGDSCDGYLRHAGKTKGKQLVIKTEINTPIKKSPG